MNERIKKLRKALDLTQQEFADHIGVKRNTIATYEIGRNTPLDAVISSICREFNVSETWLRTGEGEMFVPAAEDAVALLCAEMNASELEAEIIRAYFRIDERIREPFMRRLLQEVQAAFPSAPDAGKDIDVPAPDTAGQERTQTDAGGQERPRYHVPTDEEIEREVEEFRRRLLLEKSQADGPSPSSADGGMLA